jgi:endoglucanase
MIRRMWTRTVATACVALSLVACGVQPQEVGDAVVRVDQVGYATDEAKQAYLMASRQLPDAEFRVLDGNGNEALRGRPGASTGRWNDNYTAVRPLDLSELRTPGTYRIEISGGVKASSPPFRVVPPAEPLGPLMAANVRFFQAQRDGAQVIGSVLDRKPSHLADEKATVYETPRYDDEGKRLLDDHLTPIGGPVDVSGGWFDAGDFLKFTHTASYSVAQLLLAQRTTTGSASRELADEARHGLSWLDKMWDDRTGTLYAQVGIGAGNDNVRTDHDVWRKPEDDDAMTVRPGDPDYTIKHRPVFMAAKPGQPISPNLAGRVSAAFALAAQLDAASAPDRAKAELAKAAKLFSQADPAPEALVTAFPGAFYPESSWQDDMEFAAAELALAATALGDDRATAWVSQAGHWAKAYLSSDTRGTLGVADVSALAHADLIKALDVTRTATEVTDADLVADLKRQLDNGSQRSVRDPFRAGAVYTEFDAVPHTFGLAATANLYRTASGDRGYDAFATSQRNWALGSNPWGTSFVIGVGSTFPNCPEHQVANLVGNLDGKGQILVGAAVNGPNAAAKLAELNSFPTMRRCPVDGGDKFTAFDGQGSRFVDDVGAWQTVEPADDFTSIVLLSAALSAG